MKNIRGILFLVITMLPLLGHAQKVAYDYDTAGNRVKRYKVVRSRRAMSSDASQLFKAVPNPVTDILYISYEDEISFSGEFRYTLQSVYAETALTGISHTANCQLDVSNLQKGIYILNITYQDNEQSIKIIKK